MSAGTHTLTWSYIKDSSVHPVGDYFAVKSVELLPPETIRGDIDGSGSVGISDVTAMTDYILSCDASGLNLTAGDVDGDGHITIADISDIIDYILSGSSVLTEGIGLSNEYEIEYRIKANCLTECLVCVSH